MTKYNITPKKVKMAAYRNLVNPELMDRLETQIYDIIVKQLPLPGVRIGDVLCFENAGAYCMTEGIALFLSRDVPAVYLIREDGTAVCVRKPFETLQLNTPNYDL